MGFVRIKSVLKCLNILICQILNNGIIFPQETHSLEDTFNQWRDNFKGEGFFSFSTTNSYAVIIGYLSNKKFLDYNITKGNNGIVLIIDEEIKTETFILLNLYNLNSETEQLQSLS